MLRCSEDYLTRWIDHYPNVIALGDKKPPAMTCRELKVCIASDQMRLRYLKRKRQEIDVEIGFVNECLEEAKTLLNGGEK